MKTGSDINLTCKISQGPHELGNIFWYKGKQLVLLDSCEDIAYILINVLLVILDLK